MAYAGSKLLSILWEQSNFNWRFFNVEWQIAATFSTVYHHRLNWFFEPLAQLDVHRNLFVVRVRLPYLYKVQLAILTSVHLWPRYLIIQEASKTSFTHVKWNTRRTKNSSVLCIPSKEIILVINFNSKLLNLFSDPRTAERGGAFTHCDFCISSRLFLKNRLDRINYTNFSRKVTNQSSMEPAYRIKNYCQFIQQIGVMTFAMFPLKGFTSFIQVLFT